MTVRRYRRRDLIAELAARSAARSTGVTRAELVKGMAHWPHHYLTFVFRDVTGREVVPNPCGLWYGITDDDQGGDPA